jgi:putative restriction endonuclease
MGDVPNHALRIDHLTPTHQRRLRWFADKKGSRLPFPPPIADGQFLATRAKGIYKPAGIEYALSVRVMLSSPYADKPVEEFPDGSWSLQYFQESLDTSTTGEQYTNTALLQCQQDDVPVGVLIQVSTDPTTYEVLGLAKVMGWSSGFFTFESATLA